MCYSEFGDIIDAIARLDADVILLESARSQMELLETFASHLRSNRIGPGIYDIHSPQVPREDDLVARLQEVLRVIPKERVWVNPDCGLKTRRWEEVHPALEHMVAAAHTVRRALFEPEAQARILTQCDEPHF